MAERLYLGLVSKQLRDDRKNARALEREARAKVGYLFDSMLPGQTFKSGSWPLLNGRKIMAFVWNDMNGRRAIVRLTAPGVGHQDEYCTGLSGLYYINNFVYGTLVSPEGTTSEYMILDHRGRNYWHTLPADESALFTDQFPGTYDYEFAPEYPHKWLDSMVMKKPGMYTGTMKKIVQLLGGMNQIIPYSWGGTGDQKTHGIFINRNDGAFWVLEINQAVGGSGITTWPLEVQKEVCLGSNTPLLSFTPVPIKDFDEVVGKRQIAPYSTIEDAVSGKSNLGGPYMGWAFSASGHEAQIVVDSGGHGPSGNYVKSFRYKLSISADPVDGSPLSASLTLEEEGFTYTRNLWTNVRFPSMGSCNHQQPIALFSYEADPPQSEPYSAPIAVYYIGDEAQTFTINIKIPRWEDVRAADPVYETNLDPNDETRFAYYDEDIGRDIYGEQGTFRGGATISGIDWAETELNNYENVMDTTHMRCDMTENIGPGCFWWGTSATDIHSENWKQEKVASYWPPSSKAYDFCLTFPWYEREAFLFQERWRVDASPAAYKTHSSEWMFGGTKHTSHSDHNPLTVWWLQENPAWCIPGSVFRKVLGVCGTTDPSPPYVPDPPYSPWPYTPPFYSVSGPVSVCCEDDDLQIMYYNATETAYGDEIRGPVTQTLIQEAVAAQTVTSFKGEFSRNGSKHVMDLEDAGQNGVFFTGGLFEDTFTCSVTNTDPLWYCVMQDAFTGTGWLKRLGYKPSSMEYVGYPLQQYPVLPDYQHDHELMGWFGTPFPNQMIEE